MKAHRAAMVLAGGAIMVAGSAAFAQAPGQIPDASVVNIMRECAKIDDPTARLACYDNNIRAGGFDGRGPSVPGQSGRITGGGAPNNSAGGAYTPQGFGAASVQNPDRFQSYQERGAGPDSITARIASVREREPGVYLVTLEGGAEWLFSETMSTGFKPPRKGDEVDISHASLGSFLMRFDNQQSVRVHRIK
jgi:hypothetical protein